MVSTTATPQRGRSRCPEDGRFRHRGASAGSGTGRSGDVISSRLRPQRRVDDTVEAAGDPTPTMTFAGPCPSTRCWLSPGRAGGRSATDLASTAPTTAPSGWRWPRWPSPAPPPTSALRGERQAHPQECRRKGARGRGRAVGSSRGASESAPGAECRSRLCRRARSARGSDGGGGCCSARHSRHHGRPRRGAGSHRVARRSPRRGPWIGGRSQGIAERVCIGPNRFVRVLSGGSGSPTR
jgi:hypothetical protein